MRGGNREGAGRKKEFEGRRKVISLTLTDAQWKDINNSGLSPAAYIRKLMDSTPWKPEVDFREDFIVEIWDRVVSNDSKFASMSPEILAKACNSYISDLPKNVTTLLKYRHASSGYTYTDKEAFLEYTIIAHLRSFRGQR